ncbi:MAG: PHB depolymerase family esterase [Jatrophihabitans sp.]
MASTVAHRPCRTVGATLAVLCLVAGTAACTSSRSSTQPSSTAQVSTIARGSSTQTITVGGVARTFHLYRPATLPARTPLVVMLHGGFGTGTQAEKSYGWDAQADTGHFLLAYPDGLNRAWNTGGGCCGKPAKDHIDDVGFIKAMISTLHREIPIDSSRVFATGMSNGAIMDYTLACNTSIFAAIGPNSGTQLGACTHPTPLSVIHIHGTADTHIPYAGGRGSGTAAIDGPGIEALNATWRTNDSCPPPIITKSGVVTTSIAACPGGRTVELISITGAGHQWPGSAPKSKVQQLIGSDPPSTALNATQTIWAFFAAHPAPADR